VLHSVSEPASSTSLAPFSRMWSDRVIVQPDSCGAAPRSERQQATCKHVQRGVADRFDQPESTQSEAS
jgi:hypothetical protein